MKHAFLFNKWTLCQAINERVIYSLTTIRGLMIWARYNLRIMLNPAKLWQKHSRLLQKWDLNYAKKCPN